MYRIIWLSLIILCSFVADIHATEISAQTIITTADNALRQAVSGDVTFTLLNTIRDVTVPDDNVTLSADTPYGVRYNLPTTVNILIKANGQVVDKIVTRYSVKKYQNVVVLAHALSGRTAISADDLKYERREMSKLAAGYYTDSSKLIGLVTRRSLKAGTVLDDQVVDKPILVTRGSMVKIVARIGELEVTILGSAIQDGREGQLIRVQNQSSQKLVVGKVLADGAVLVTQ